MEEGEITILAREVNGSSKYEKIMTMIEESEKLKPSLEGKAARLADRLVPYTLAGTGLVYLLTRNVTKALSVLMVDFSCALKLSMPISVLSAMREAQSHGITVKGGKLLEAMAEADTIVFDKTGTLTQNKMTVQQIYIDGKVYEPKELDITDQTQRYLLYDAVLTNDSSIVEGKEIGDPTEYALLEMFRNIQVEPCVSFGSAGINEDILRKSMDRMEEVPFDSDRKLMSTKYSLNGVSTMAFAAGVCLLALVIFVPFLHSVFSVENLSATAIAQTIGLSFIPTVIIQLIKVCRNKKEK